MSTTCSATLLRLWPLWTDSNQPQTNSPDSGIARGFSVRGAADDFLCASHGWYRIEGLAGLDCHLFAARAWIMLQWYQWPVTFHYISLPSCPRVCFNMFWHAAAHDHSTMVDSCDSCDSCRYPVLWMSLAQLVGGSATSICVVLISLLLASISYALLRFDQMHRATLELSLASEAICSQAPHANRNVTNMWNRWKWWKWGVKYGKIM